eukprot:TRINITY_DN112_c0_g2_i1.p1 TRINITY_DN112_c0_g2~~TRINITY_DN112_c0_g2_i1.p1  ORF type:complete len:1077 (+),score=474.84 TRINITY_DN112_c0_g2_i1:93-3233(+)
MAQRQSGQFSPVTASRRKSTPGFSTLSLSRGLDSNISPVQGSSPLGASPYGSPARRRQSAHPGAHDSPGSPGRAARRKSCQSVGNWMDGAPEEAGDQNVQVMLRVRPFNKRELRIHEEKSDGYLRSIIEMPDGVQAGVVHFLEKISGQDDYAVAEEFQFDKCFWSIPLEDHPYKHAFCSQETVYEHVGAPALKNAWNGFNTCIFAYGQTGAGKTHTMMGPFTFEGHSAEISGTPGVIPQLCKALYLSIEAKRKEQEESEFKVIRTKYETELSAYEIYNERVRDLFFNHTPGREPGEELKVRKHPVEGPFVDKISKLNPERWQDCLSMIVEGNEKRTVGATAMNADSSRSHSVFQIKFTQVETSVPKDKFEKPVTNRKYSIINLIDLAGSERNKKSQATGERLVEASNINLSLTTLKRVIDALVYNSQHRSAPKQVPYRDSVLTMLLSHSLGGNSKTMMVAAVSPHHDNAEETLNTLRYASAARKIVNLVRTNEDSKAKQNLLLKEQLQAMQEQLEKAQTGEGGVQDLKALDELRDQIQVGEEELKRAAEETKQVQQELRRIQEEKELEKERRYHAAFQHSFQMVILRRQKEAAQKEAMDAERLREDAEKASQLKREASMLRKEVKEVKRTADNAEEYAQHLKDAIEQQKKEQEAVLQKAYGIRWVEQHRAKLAHQVSSKSIDELRAKHKHEMEQVISQAAAQYEELVKVYSDREGELLAKVQAAKEETARLRKFDSTHTQQLQSLEVKAEEWKQQSLRKDSEWKRELADAEKRARDNMSALRQRLERRISDLEEEVERVRARARQAEEAQRHAAAQRERELQELLEARVKHVRSECQHQAEQQLEELRRQLAREQEKQRDGLSECLRDHRDRSEQDMVALHEKLESAEARVDEQCHLLKEVSKREARYRALYRELSSLLAAPRGEELPEGVREFLDKARRYQAELQSHPIDREAVRLQQRPLGAAATLGSPVVATSQQEDAALNGSLEHSSPCRSPSSGRRSPARQRMRVWSRPQGTPGGASGSPARSGAAPSPRSGDVPVLQRSR